MRTKMDGEIVIRPYTETDAPYLAAIFYNTIHKVNMKDYTEEQLNVWAPSSSLQAESWMQKWRKLPPLVAMCNNRIAGFAEFESNGHIDCFYCHHEYQGRGVGSALMAAIEQRAREIKLNHIFAEVSITAKPFFEAKGFVVKNEQSVDIRGVALTNFVMIKTFA